MNLTKLIRNIWADSRLRELGVRQDIVKAVVLVTLDHIRIGVLEHGLVKLKGLFTLELKEVQGRKMAHPQTQEEMHSQNYYKIKVKPSIKMKEELSLLNERKHRRKSRKTKRSK